MQAWTTEHRDELGRVKPDDDDMPRLQELGAEISKCIQRSASR
jgi:hypothetical protein